MRRVYLLRGLPTAAAVPAVLHVHVLLLLLLLQFLDVPRMHGGVMMWRLVSCAFCLIVSVQPGSWSGWAAADELESDVKIEVLFKPVQCAPKSKKGDLMNVHYDGFLAKDGSQFYCRFVSQ